MSSQHVQSPLSQLSKRIDMAYNKNKYLGKDKSIFSSETYNATCPDYSQNSQALNLTSGFLSNSLLDLVYTPLLSTVHFYLLTNKNL